MGPVTASRLEEDTCNKRTDTFGFTRAPTPELQCWTREVPCVERREVFNVAIQAKPDNYVEKGRERERERERASEPSCVCTDPNFDEVGAHSLATGSCRRSCAELFSECMRGRGTAELGSKASTNRAHSMVALPAPDTDVSNSLTHPHHLIVMSNGIVGSASDWKFAADQFRERFGDEVLVHCSSRNAATLTFDGVDVMGHRLAQEVKEIVESSPGLTRISFIAHSLGGLIARYAVGQLYNPFGSVFASVADAFNGTILGLQPVNFITVATPHLGSRGNGQLPLLGGLSFLERVAMSSAHWVVGRTGKHLFLTDGDELQAPLLQRMVRDCAEGQFFSALGSFERRVAYANVNFDHMVGCRTATFRRESENHEIKEEAIDTKYPHIVNIEYVPPEASPVDNLDSDPAAEEMISGLRKLSWQRVDVSFSRSAQKLAAHSTIQVKSYWMHSDGADVITHIIDNFRL